MSSAVRLQRRTWTLFLAGTAVLLIAMAALSTALLRSERRELSVKQAHERERALATAAARIDDWLAPVLAREAGRHHSDYSSYRAPRRVFDQDLQRLPEGSVLEPSPLLGFQADTIRLHLQWSEAEGASSPQVPIGRQRELALASGLPPATLALAEQRLLEAQQRIDLPALAARLRETSPGAVLEGPAAVDPNSCATPDELRESAAGAGLVEDAGGAAVGALRPVLLADGEPAWARHVALRRGSVLQVVLLDWPVLEGYLLEQAGVGQASLVASETGIALGQLPFRLVDGSPAASASAWTPLRSRVALAWFAGLVCLSAAGWSLRRGLADAERRARFAAALSHELRTPLTTLRLYSDMLADGVISDEDARQEYLETIRAESGRLASLVENVLLHARVEGAGPRELSRLRVEELVESIAPVLRRRTQEAGRPLLIAIEPCDDAEVEVDRSAVERVLFNLVDNACKHAVGAADPTLRLEVRQRGGFVDLSVSDEGPGIPRELASAVFEAFRRGEEKGAPGAGLGLSLSRELARDLRGELALVPSDSGACFRLSLRVA